MAGRAASALIYSPLQQRRSLQTFILFSLLSPSLPQLLPSLKERLHNVAKSVERILQHPPADLHMWPAFTGRHQLVHESQTSHGSTIRNLTPPGGIVISKHPRYSRRTAMICTHFRFVVQGNVFDDKSWQHNRDFIFKSEDSCDGNRAQFQHLADGWCENGSSVCERERSPAEKAIVGAHCTTSADK